MKRVFREAYDRELALLKERAAEFAADHPGLADRLGGLLEENLDPTVAGLLEGSAFLAARVQVKMQEEFRGFTRELLDQIFPEALMPTPAVMLVQAKPPLGNDALLRGMRFDAGEVIDARFQDADTRVSCRFSLTAPLELWPITLAGARYLASPGQVGALGVEICAGTKSGLMIELNTVELGGEKQSAAGFDTLPLDHLSVHFSAPVADAARLYEQVHFTRLRVSLSWLDRKGDRVIRRLPEECVTPIGFRRDERLFPRRKRQFSGFAYLREFFVFPRKFLGLRLDNLRAHLAGANPATVQIIFEFGTLSQTLAQRFEPGHLLLHAVPAINLFEEVSSNARLDRKQHEYIVTPNSSPVTHFEFHEITEVWAVYPGQKAKRRVWPLYGLPDAAQDPRGALYYSLRRKPRRLTLQERRHGMSRYRYRGTETYLTLYEPPDARGLHRFQVRGLCSNRHLPEYLPIMEGRDDFSLSSDQSVVLSCVSEVTPPRDSLVDLDSLGGHRAEVGESLWRLISYLSLSRFGLEGDNPEATAAAIRELLSLFADLSDISAESQIRALRSVQTRPVTRTIAMADGFHPARGLEVTLHFDEEGAESSGITLLGAVLDQFIAEYAAVNSFTQTVLSTAQRGVVARFPPRSGQGPLL